MTPADDSELDGTLALLKLVADVHNAIVGDRNYS